MNIEITNLDMILNYLETTSLEPHDEYTSEFTYKDQKILYKYIKELQQENQQLKEELKCSIGIVEHNKIIQNHILKERKLKIQISAREEEYIKLEKNWNELKEWVNRYYDYYMNSEDFIGGRLCFADIKNKMQELEKGKSE